MTATHPGAFLHAVETPAGPIRAPHGRLSLTGWCLLPGSPSVPRVRLTVSGQSWDAHHGSRPDVASAFPHEAAAAASGFGIEAQLAPGLHRATLEAFTNSVDWTHLRTFTVDATEANLAVSVEWPAERVVRDSVRLQGWCAHPQFDLAEVWLHYGHRRIRGEHGLPRMDVTALLPGAPDAHRAGFIAVKNLPAGRGPLRIRAVTTCGKSFFAPTDVFIDIATDEENTTPLQLAGTAPRLASAPTRAPEQENPSPGPHHRILFVLYGDFTSNSALHVTSLADRLGARGHTCIVAVPCHAETAANLHRGRYTTVNFADYTGFDHGAPPDIIHAWTTRENIRRFCEPLLAACDARLVVHLEDHEQHLLEARLGRTRDELLALPTTELDALVPESLSHPLHSRAFLARADAHTLVLDRLAELLPPGKQPAHIITPAADETCFQPRPIPWDVRNALGWDLTHTVLFYHGNVHASNRDEVRSLYEAVLRLNQTGTPTTLLRTGRDDEDFLGPLAGRIAPHVVSLGLIAQHRHLPALMSLADFFVQPGRPDAFNDYRFPSKLPEFFALGRPVILPRTNLGLALQDGVDALVLPVADAESIATAIQRLRADPALASRLSAGALAYAERHFNWHRAALALEGFYNALPAKG